MSLLTSKLGSVFEKILVFGLLVVCQSLSTYDEAKFVQFREKIEGDVLELAKEVERLYQSRCNSSLVGCAFGNYNECSSKLPYPTCIDKIWQCSTDPSASCSMRFDFTSTVASLPRAQMNGDIGNPTDPQVIESTCFTRGLETYFVDKRQHDQVYWDENFDGINPLYMYFGSKNGPFRIYPAFGREECGLFDARTRPWYTAASSGPKNVVMIIDKSGSMQGARLDMLKTAAKRVVQTLSVSDRVAVIAFDSAVHELSNNDGYLYTATQDNKDSLMKAIDELQAESSTNFYDAFEKAFDLIDRSSQNEMTVACNTAILFLTDGEMSYPPNINTTDVLNLVDTRMNQTESILGKPMYLFTYSISEEGEDPHQFPSQLACSVKNGVWSKIATDDEIEDSLSSYQRLFALGLGDEKNTDFVAWVEPYKFFMSDILGTTISAPVYDRSKQPALFLGVVGIDFALAAMNIALAGSSNVKNTSVVEESIKRVVIRSTAQCPSINLSHCELESYRRQGNGGTAALCSSSCSEKEFVVVEETKCGSVSDYPSNLWNNTNDDGVSYVNRVYCPVNELEPSSVIVAAERKQSNTPIIIIGSACAVGALLLILVLIAVYRKMKKNTNQNTFSTKQVQSSVSTLSVQNSYNATAPAIPIDIPSPIPPPTSSNWL